MKVNIFNRILLMFLTLLISLISILSFGFFIGLAINVIPAESVNIFLSTIDYNWQLILIGSLVSILFFLVSIKLLFMRNKQDKVKSAMVKHSELGVIRISIRSLELMALNVIKEYSEIKDVRIKTIPTETGIKFHVKLFVMPNIVLFEISQDIQNKVKEHIENYAGVSVEDIIIFIDNDKEQIPKVN